MDITLALGAGGVKGNAHIGVLRRLEKEGFRIRGIAGSSFGGLVAVFYALGYSPDQIEDMFALVDQAVLYGRAPDEGPALLGLAGVRNLLEGSLSDRTFEDLILPCVVTAVDLKSGTEVIFSKGRLVDAILASIAMPGIFPARYTEEYELVDGGVLDPVPVAPARSLAPQLPVVAVVLTAPIGSPAQSWTIPMPPYFPRTLMMRLSKMRYAQAWDTFIRSMDIIGRAVAQYRLEIDRPDAIIRPQLDGIETLDPVDVHAVVRKGEEAVEKALPELRRLSRWRKRLQRAIGGRS